MTRTGRLERAEIGLAGSLEEPGAKRVAPDPDSHFRILVIGDFSGRSSRGVVEPGSLGFDRLPIRVDRDNLDEVMAELDVELRLYLGSEAGPAILLRPREIDDFHPDRIFERAQAFAGLRRLRENLEDPEKFEEAAAEVRSWGVSPAPSAAAEPVSDPSALPDTTSAEELVAEMLETARQREQDVARAAGFDSFLRQIVQPHLAVRDQPQHQELVTAVETAVASWMRSVLHHSEFQALEAAWRGLNFLVDRLETDAEFELFVLDVSKAEMAADLRSAKELSGSAIYKMLVGNTVGTPGADRWAVLAGLYTFDQTLEDVALLGRLSKIARAAGAPFLAAASPHIVGCESLTATPDPEDWRPSGAHGAELWEVLRELPETSYLGLALPRFLLRLPYGPQTDPTEQFAFEELADGPSHEDYLWGNPAVACVCLLGQAFAEFGWQLRPGGARDLQGLPLHIFEAGGEARVQPCAEVLLTDRAAERILEQGLTPLLSLKDRDSIRLVRFQSIANPPTRLSGRWS